MTAVGWLPAGPEELFGPEATAEESYDVLTVDVPPTSWISALETARDRLGCTYFDWLSAVDEPGTGFRVAAHVVALGPVVRRLLLRTTVPHESPALPTAVAVYAGAAWHERETHEMFGVEFADHPGLDHLLLPEGFEGHPLRKDFVLAARVAKAWPGAKEPGESDHGGPRRRQMLPPGVPDPNEWGPQKGQLPPAPARPARGAGRAATQRPARAAGDRPVRRTRTAGEGSASQASPPGTGTGTDTGTGTGTEASFTPRRSRTAAEGSASQTPMADQTSPADESSVAPAPRRSRSASQGSASQRAATDAGQPEKTGSSGEAPASAPRSPDAPWHHDRPAFDEPADKRAEGDASREPQTPDEPVDPDEPRESDRKSPESSESPESPESENPESPTGGPR
ncbi:dehydrogenase [Streptomyces sp. WAC 04229]|uniref:NADH-quinone oxidoreductase subunit C n=1 Tax=Streptomyces sp. WAC 04229 TaxID=2203206 RepID=UPI000F74573D|nr:NADH-quinone oxidoreductase subunit C [Streptomyces sp. WAC 04229]RSN51434.1 dehydrogenase [Streptomyces sp. WAC 04229]